MLTPFVSKYDPVMESEGSLDPLGLSAIAEQLAETVLPGITARMWRPRFLTAMTVSSAVLEDLEAVATDQVSLPHVVFEWYAIEALARGGDGTDLSRVPGIDKARSALKRGSGLSARTYLKTPTVFGFHGVYKRLATNLRLVDDDLGLEENGASLLKIWEEEEGCVGFFAAIGGGGATLRKQLRTVVEEGLKRGSTSENRRWRFFVDLLHPADMGKKESEFLWKCLTSAESEIRREIFQFMAKLENLKEFKELGGEPAFFPMIKKSASLILKARLVAIERFENLCWLLDYSFKSLQYISTHSVGRPVTPANFKGKLEGVAASVAVATKRARESLERVDDPHARRAQSLLEGLASTLDGVRDAATLLQALVERHKVVQKEKSESGKALWFEESGRGGIMIRPRYRLHDEPEKSPSFVHGYRLHSVASFIEDMGATRYAKQ